MKIRKFLKISVLLLSFFAAGAISVSALNKGANLAEAKLVKPIVWDEGGGGGYTDTTPRITFLAHGLGGYARDWSNDYSMFWSGNEKFAYDSSSSIEKMRKEYLNLNREEMDLYVYSIRSTNTKGVPGAGLYKIGYGADKTYTYTKIDTSIKNSFSSHSLVVMQYISGCANFSNGLEGVCEEYKTGVNEVLDAYKISKGNKYRPHINLIGHSMGGLVNLSYAIENPSIVSSLVSIGTPYNGSTLDNDIVNTFVPDFVNNPCMCGKCDHTKHTGYMCDLAKRKNKWNEVYRSNKQIKFLAISAATSFDLLNWMLRSSDLSTGMVEMSDSILEKIGGALAGYSTIGLFAGAIGSYHTDLCVDIGSQRATGYDGVIHFDKTFYRLNCNPYKHSQAGPSAPHNLETYDSDIHEAIMSFINFGISKKYYSQIKSGIEVTLLGKINSGYLLKLTNYTGKEKNIYYNSKMCFEGHANAWTSLSDVCATGIVPSCGYVYIQVIENVAATDIAISYEDDSQRRQIIALDKLNGDDLYFRSRTRDIPFMSYNSSEIGVKAKILAKNDSTWMIEVTNTGPYARTFYYNKKLCFEGDAEKWKNLEHVSDPFNLSANESVIIFIEENGWAGTMAISYMEGGLRHVFYAYDLSITSTMTYKTNSFDPNADDSCISENSLVTLANGKQKRVKDLKGNEKLLVWNFESGSFDTSPILFVDQHTKKEYEIINLFFSDGTKVEVIGDHGFFDISLNEYLYIGKNAKEFIGHKFFSVRNGRKASAILTKVKFTKKVAKPYSPVTSKHLCFFVDGKLSMPSGLTGLFNYFDVDRKTMKYDITKMTLDIEQYGLLSYNEFSLLIPDVSEQLFDAVNGQYLNISIGKGIISKEGLIQLAKKYCNIL